MERLYNEDTLYLRIVALEKRVEELEEILEKLEDLAIKTSLDVYVNRKDK